MAKSLLLVDDDVKILETAQDVLEAAGFDVRIASNGTEALERLREQPCQVMVSDYNLPDRTGAELSLQAKALYPLMVVILMTGQAEINLGPAQSVVRAVLTKPVNPSELIEILRKIVD